MRNKNTMRYSRRQDYPRILNRMAVYMYTAALKLNLAAGLPTDGLAKLVFKNLVASLHVMVSSVRISGDQS